MAFDWQHVPLNVKTYREAYNKLAGPICVSLMGIITGVLLMSYELLYLNVEDADFRDMLWDYRITSFGIQYHHKHFFNAAFCCNEDLAVFRYRCNETLADYWLPTAPYCQPQVEFTCTYSLRSSSCNQTRVAVYKAVGLDPYTGQASNCSRAGRVRVRAVAGLSAGGDPFVLRVLWKGQVQEESFRIPPSGISSVPQSELDAFVDEVAAKYSDPMARTPPVPLGRAVVLEGTTVLMGLNLTNGRPWNEGLGFPWELWPWPPQSSCPNTAYPPQLWSTGTINTMFPRFNAALIPTLSLTVLGNSLQLPTYQVNPVDPDSPGGDVVVNRLTAVAVKVALVSVRDGCSSWQLDPGNTSLTYGAQVWTGAAAQLAAGGSSVGGGWQLLSITVRDVAAPARVALPPYGGERYIFGTLISAGAWAFSGGLVIVLTLLIHIQVQRNRGQPNVFWRYMQRFRGW